MCRVSFVSLYEADAHNNSVCKDVCSLATLLRLVFRLLNELRLYCLRTGNLKHLRINGD